MNGFIPQVSKAQLYLSLSLYDMCQVRGPKRADEERGAKTSHISVWIDAFHCSSSTSGLKFPSQHGFHGGMNAWVVWGTSGIRESFNSHKALNINNETRSVIDSLTKITRIRWQEEMQLVKKQRGKVLSHELSKKRETKQRNLVFYP